MAQEQRVPTAIGEPVVAGREPEGVKVRLGQPPVIFQTQVHGFIPLEQPEQLKQWEEDALRFYGVSVDASNLRGIAGESCSGGCSDDCCVL